MVDSMRVSGLYGGSFSALWGKFFRFMGEVFPLMGEVFPLMGEVFPYRINNLKGNILL